jgi:hypothetical protein
LPSQQYCRFGKYAPGPLVVLTNGSNGTPIIRAVLNSAMNRNGRLARIDGTLPQWGSGGLQAGTLVMASGRR